jgi:uncharacterized protein (DUF1015 family)
MRQQYLERHPENVVRIIKNPDYQDAADRLTRWIETGILKYDDQPSFYPYEQVFEYEGMTLSRIGFIGLVGLDEDNLAVKGHERVLTKPLEDRLNLIRANEANDGLIFTLYSDPEMIVDESLAQFTAQHDPEYELYDDFGVCHKVWQLAEPTLTEAIVQALKGKPLYIADGHHRFQTAVLYRQECLEKGWQATVPESFDKRMVALFNMESPQVKILATHRAIRNLSSFSGEVLISKLNNFFQVRECRDAGELFDRLGEAEHQIGLICSAPEGVFLLRLESDALENPDFMPQVRGIARELDVNILHEGILSPMLGIGPEELAGQMYVDYLRDRSALVSGVQNGRYQAGFLLNPTTVDEVRAISELGEKMPQKSTDFYPKLLTGLVFMKMVIDR